ncbi:hypothetical protein [Phaeobacter sp. 22II1-1F12B]|uniref:hypothetical protein n=1 Tax=Phaeobacter sp. 22II1-1F12B TaxID=1317111 RepID=UPI000B5258B1|nr:hypothetical protein [Phaeobacter sp. 22II1-1F12B]OWU80444.1 hypothetical protein ATO1_08845 [Phaeobacter sp. 22II1-1F12B]
MITGLIAAACGISFGFVLGIFHAEARLRQAREFLEEANLALRRAVERNAHSLASLGDRGPELVDLSFIHPVPPKK